MGAMLGLVFADTSVALFGFWELTSVTSFLLIGFDHRRQAARRAAIQALVVTGIGGLALLVAAVALRLALGSWQLSEMLDKGAALQAGGLFWLVLIPVLLAAFTKSAQVPFHFWLPNAMEAPTPVSAYLHSATMVQAGVYLLARSSPLLSGSPAWTATLMLFGGVTMLWGSAQALRQTDLKLMLAHTTVGALGVLVLLIGVATEAAIAAAVLFFLAHALYKAALFLVVGIIDSSTGTREVSLLRGLTEKLPATFIAAVLAAFSMIGLPASIGFLGKEEMYAAVAEGRWWLIVALVALVLVNAAFGAVAMIVALRPFLGVAQPTPLEPRENSPSLLAGPVLMALGGIAGGVAVGWVGTSLLAPATGRILGHAVEPHLELAIEPLSVVFALSLLTWSLAAVLFWFQDWVRSILRRTLEASRWTFDRGFDSTMAALLQLAARVSDFTQTGKLRVYVATLAVLFAAALLLPLLLVNGMPSPAAPSILFPGEWGLLVFVVVGVGAVVPARTLLSALLSLGVQGVALTLIFMTFGAPDLAFTQMMVEVVTVVMLGLVMVRLRLHHRASRLARSALIDAAIGVACGLGVTLVLLTVLGGRVDLRLSEFFAAASLPLAHGRNVVNVILVDFRALDTLGEISVLATAGIAIVALVRRRLSPPRVIAPVIRWFEPLPPAIRWFQPRPAAIRWFRPEALT